ncbi:MAG: hypothetical protein WC344_02955 [Bacilli bacterium]|jgi:hypothetical protein
MKKMTAYWIFGAIYLGTVLIGLIVLMPAIITAAMNGGTSALVAVISGAMAWVVVISLLGVAQLVLSIVHLVTYYKHDFADQSKVGHALYQFFFGFGIIGLIIVLVI